MKWFLSVCLLAAGVAIAGASCGPQEHFCPTTNPDPNDFACHANFDAMGGMGGMIQSKCDAGAQMLCPDGVTIVCNRSDCP